MGIVNTVRVLPSHPILVAEAVEYDTGAAAEFTAIKPEAVGVAVADGEVFLTDTHWVEVPEPIVWDGEDETAERIRDMLSGSPFDAGSDRGANEGPDDAPLCIWAGDEFQDPVDVLFPGDSITVNGRWPFAIRGEGDGR